MAVIFLFIDGIGLGEPGPYNPLVDHRWDAFTELTDGQGLSRHAKPVQSNEICFSQLSATLDVPGLPQSGTGQASLFSGMNASKIAGKHFGPFPHSKTRYLLEEKSLFHQLKQKGYKPHFINAYPDIFFEKMEKRERWTCTTLMASSAGQALNGLKELKEGKSIAAGINQAAWKEQLDLDVEKIDEEEAAERVIRVLEGHDLVMFEYYLTDKAGHSMDKEMSESILDVLNRFIRHILRVKQKRDHLVISSDHGNLENISLKTHTRNPVPLMIHGKTGGIKKAKTIMDVPEIIADLLP